MEKSSFKQSIQNDRAARVTTTEGFRHSKLSKKSGLSGPRNAT